MNQRNFQKELEDILSQNETKGKKLFLHSCCAPCSSYVLSYLSDYFEITVFYYNPNITDENEYKKRVEEQKRLIASIPHKYDIHFVEGKYEPERFFMEVKGLEKEKEGGKRCEKCFQLRLSEAVNKAKEMESDFVTTTLTISPLKNAPLLNEIGEEEAGKKNIPWLPSDFKKKGGYQKSILLSKEYDLYRQDFCGCIYSELEARERRKS